MESFTQQLSEHTDSSYKYKTDLIQKISITKLNILYLKREDCNTYYIYFNHRKKTHNKQLNETHTNTHIVTQMLTKYDPFTFNDIMHMWIMWMDI